MRSHQLLSIASLFLLTVGLLAVGCGGSGDDLGAPDLSQIATATPPDTLPEVIIVGETLAPVQGETYVVQAGDSPASIAAQFGTTADAIMEANGITDPTQLVVGQELTIPGVAVGATDVLGATAEPSPTQEPTQEPALVSTPEPAATLEGNVYVVQSGDYPASIAEQFGISVEALMEANGITDPTALYIGQELIIPSPAPTATPEP